MHTRLLLFVVPAFLCSAAVATPSAPAPLAAPLAGALAKAPKKKKVEKPIEKPSGTPSDPRASEPVDSGGGAAAAEAPIAPGSLNRGMARIEFDDRLIKGQTNKANAIYLFERRESAMRSLLKKRVDFHDEIDETLEDQ